MKKFIAILTDKLHRLALGNEHPDVPLGVSRVMTCGHIHSNVAHAEKCAKELNLRNEDDGLGEWWKVYDLD